MPTVEDWRNSGLYRVVADDGQTVLGYVEKISSLPEKWTTWSVADGEHDTFDGFDSASNYAISNFQH